jgi:hypothetical protein
MNAKLNYVLTFLTVILSVAGCLLSENRVFDSAKKVWPKLKMENKPGTYWWWMGSAVDNKNISYNLENLQKVGIGGVTIVPIYGVKGLEQRYIDYLSPKWMDMLAHTVSESRRLGMWVDMTTGTGWPFGGSHITPPYAAVKIEHKIFNVSGGERLQEKMDVSSQSTIMAYSDDGTVINLTESIIAQRQLDWTAPPGQWKVYWVWQSGTGQKVKRAAPGNEGLALDPFSVAKLDYYLQRFNKAFNNYEGQSPRAQYHDSYEYHNANWTDDFLVEFKIRQGYDLRQYLPLLFGEEETDEIFRVKSDYRETLSELHLEYIQRWCQWSHDKGCLTREQAHGAPANLLDLYATADIPETETFGSTSFKIPGFRRDLQNVGKDAPNPLVLQFASSAAHVAGRPLIASETCTWLREHYKAALSQVKPEVDQLFLSGINHIFYHGNAYSPAEAEWPGWLFYASTHFEKENAIWHDFPALNDYVARCQSILQAGKPDNEILLYWPVYDIWHSDDLMIRQLNVHKISWFLNSNFGEIAAELKKKGYSFDYISDRQLLTADYKDNAIRLPGGDYHTILLPECEHLPVGTWKKLMVLANKGAKILVNGKLPADVPGLANLEERRQSLTESISGIKFDPVGQTGLRKAIVGKGEILLGENPQELLTKAGIVQETITQNGAGFIRRRYQQGHYYFLANLAEKTIDGWIPMAVPFESALILDPESSAYGAAATRQKEGKSEIYLQIAPGESFILQTFQSQKIEAPPWKYFQDKAEIFEINGKWKVSFIEGDPVKPDSFVTDELRSWTTFPDKEAMRFAGTARYSIRFNLPAKESNDWKLDLGTVRESARVKINGQDAGTLWSIPFHMLVGKFLQSGENLLEVEVTNLSANRIADMDRRQVPWRNFHDINFVNINYEKFDASVWPLMESGLIGPVLLKAVTLKNVSRSTD